MPKGSSAMLIIRGLVGPKPRTKVVGDGQQVYIPVLDIIHYQQWGNREGELQELYG